MKIKGVKEISASREVTNALKRLSRMVKPGSDFGKLVSQMSVLYKVETGRLEYYLSKYSAWQSYYAEQVAIAEIIKIVAESQLEAINSYCVEKSSGTINAKKELAKSDPLFEHATKVYNEAKSVLKVLTMNFYNAERGYRASSRIMGRRLGVKELD